MHAGLKNVGSALKYIVIVIVIYSQLFVKNEYKNPGFCQKLKISCGLDRTILLKFCSFFFFFLGMYGETLDFNVNVSNGST